MQYQSKTFYTIDFSNFSIASYSELAQKKMPNETDPIKNNTK